MYAPDLPPLNALVAFEASARLLSFTAAADELEVTQGAISRQVKLLEDNLGQPLIVRSRPRLSLTPTGVQYLSKITPCLHMIADASSLARSDQTEQLTIVTTSAMASFWLLPRLTGFQKKHPHINARVIAVDSLNSLTETEFDMGLYYFRSPPAEYHAIPLFEERVFPVCSPKFLALHPEVSEPEGLLESHMLALESGEDWVNWPEWFNSCGVTPSLDFDHTTAISSYPLVIQSALNGEGVALAWQTLVDDYLDSGLLVAPTGRSLSTQSQFYFISHRDKKNQANDHSEILTDWLFAEAAGDKT